jgi:hypothetical protein
MLKKKLFDLGIKWISNFRPDVEKFYLLYINEQNQLTRGVNYKYWIDDDRKELSVQELLSIQIKEENPITSIKTENMKELKIEVPEGYENDKGKSTFEKIIFKKIKVELPKTWEEFCNQNSVGTEYIITEFSDIANTDISKRDYTNDKNLLSTKEDAEAHLALIQLHRLRDVYRQGWVPDWNDGTGKYCILFNPDNLDIVTYTRAPHFLSFQSREIAEEFIKNFKDLIEKVKVLIS